jgi:hypothetical protein
MVQLGCFWGPLSKALGDIETKYGAASKYASLVSAACACLED